MVSIKTTNPTQKIFLVLLLLLINYLNGLSANEKPIFAVPSNILSNMSEADAKITFDAIIIQALKKQHNFNVELLSHRQFETGLLSGSIEGFVMAVDKFVELQNSSISVEGKFMVAPTGRSPYVRYVVLCRKEQTPKNLADFKGAEIIVCTNESFEIPNLWLDLKLREENLERAKTFFSSIKHEANPSKSLIPLFFGKTDICMIRKSVWKTYSELNPQLATQLQPLAISPPVAEIVGGFNSRTYNTNNTSLTKRLINMHHETEGQSLLKIVKINQFITFQDSYLDSARKIIADHQRAFPNTSTQ